jgi:hypothetical protein
VPWVCGWFGLAGGAMVLASFGLLAFQTLAVLVQEVHVAPLREAA